MSSTASIPTVVDVELLEPNQDIESLRASLNDPKNKLSELIEIVCKRSNAQRQVIIQDYKGAYPIGLDEDIKTATSSNLQKLLLALLDTPVDFITKQLYEAIQKKNASTVINLICGLTRRELQMIDENYNKMYNEFLSEAFGKYFEGTKFLLFCIAMLDNDYNRADFDVEAEVSTINDNPEIRDVKFIDLVVKSNTEHLKSLRESYKRRFPNRTIEDDINKYFSGDFRDGLLAVCACNENPAAYYAKQLQHSMKGLLTNRDDQLIQIIVMRSEVDLNQIKEEYLNKYGEELGDRIKKQTSGNYKEALLALIE